jgi:hypothetical protein
MLLDGFLQVRTRLVPPPHFDQRGRAQELARQIRRIARQDLLRAL